MYVVCVCMNVCTLNIQYTCEGQRTNRYHSVLMRKAGDLTKTGLASRCFDRILERNSLKGKKNIGSWFQVLGTVTGAHIMAGVHGREDLLPQWCQEKGRLEKERRRFQCPLKDTALMT